MNEWESSVKWTNENLQSDGQAQQFPTALPKSFMCLPHIVLLGKQSLSRVLIYMRQSVLHELVCVIQGVQKVTEGF